MTVAPLTPAAAPFPTIGAAAGTTPPGDFLAEILQALASGPADGAEAGSSAPDVAVPFETVAAQPPQGPKAAQPPQGPKAAQPRQGPKAAQPPVGPKAAQPPAFPKASKAPNQDADVEPVETPAADLPAQGLLIGVSVPFETVAAQPPAGPRAEVDNPGLHLGVGHTEHPVNPKHVEALPLPEGPQEPGGPQPVLPNTSTATQTPAAPPTSPPVQVSAPLVVQEAAPVQAPSIPDQVFGEITGLTSRGNGTHRITMKLQPEQLGEVRVVLTLREGTVHVRLAAGQEARAALLDGSPELSRLLEHTGATETRIVVRELPTTAVAPAQQTAPQTSTADTASSNLLTSGDRSPDRHARTRADHLAKDGDDGSRAHRAGGPRDVTPIRSVLGSGSSAVDLAL